MRGLLGVIVGLGIMLGVNVASAEELRIGYMPYLPYSNLLYVRQQQALEQELKREGRSDIKVTWKQFVSGATVSEALAAKEIDVAALGATPALIGRASGQDTRAISLISTGPKTHGLVVRSDLGITDVRQLKGKKVATTFGSSVFELLVSILNTAGMKTSDVELLNMTPPDMLTALRTKQIDAAVVWDPLLLVVTGDGTAKLLRDGTGLNSNVNLLVARGGFLEQSNGRAMAQLLLKALDSANTLINSHRAPVAASVAPLIGLPEQTTESALQRYQFTTTISNDVLHEIETSAKFLEANKYIRRSVDVKQFVEAP